MFRAVIAMVTTIVATMVITGGCLHWGRSSFMAGKVCVAGSREGAKLRAVVSMGSTALVAGGCVCSAPPCRRREAGSCRTVGS